MSIIWLWETDLPSSVVLDQSLELFLVFFFLLNIAKH